MQTDARRRHPSRSPNPVPWAWARGCWCAGRPERTKPVGSSRTELTDTEERGHAWAPVRRLAVALYDVRLVFADTDDLTADPSTRVGTAARPHHRRPAPHHSRARAKPSPRNHHGRARGNLPLVAQPAVNVHIARRHIEIPSAETQLTAAPTSAARKPHTRPQGTCLKQLLRWGCRRLVHHHRSDRPGQLRIGHATGPGDECGAGRGHRILMLVDDQVPGDDDVGAAHLPE